MLDWLSPLAFLQTLIRVAIVWIAFYGAGHVLERILPVRKFFRFLPKEISGIIFLIFLEIPLSILGIMNRTVTPILLLLFSFLGMLLLVKKIRNSEKHRKISVTLIIGLIALLVVAVMNLTYASMPNLSFDDPLITYAVQPDRWLNEGRIHWLEETVFSGFPLTYEMMSVWPASLSSDRIDQLSVLQVFQMTLLFIALFRGMQILRIKKKFRIPLAITVLLGSMLYYWSSLAKTDTAAILFCTLALASAVRELKDKSTVPYTSWFLMGLAFATKQTALLVFVPFILYKGLSFWRSSTRIKTISLLCISIVPLIFSVRTMLHTGSPTYPEHQFQFLVKDEWRLLPRPEEIILLNDRNSEIHASSNYSIPKHIGIFMTSMEGILLLLLGGIVIAFLKKDRSWLLFLPLFAYFTVAIVILWPPWWGAKYSILIYPFVALMGVKAMQSYERFTAIFLAFVCVVSFVVPGFIVFVRMKFPADYRYTVAKSVLTGEWDTSFSYQILMSSSEGMTYMWLNSALPDGSVILSLHEEKRYFYDHEIYVGWRHPRTQPLYLDNSLAEECLILDAANIEYVTFYRRDPCIMEMENRLAVLDHIGQNDILEPLITVSGGYLVCKYNSPNI